MTIAFSKNTRPNNCHAADATACRNLPVHTYCRREFSAMNSAICIRIVSTALSHQASVGKARGEST